MPFLTDLDYENPVTISSQQIKTIAIIGGGASGAIILDSLLKEPSGIEKIVIFERQNELGGVWFFNKDIRSTPNELIKSGNSHLDNDPQLPNPFHDHTDKDKLVLPKNNQERFIQTPSYYGIKTNIIENMMTYSDNKRWEVEGDEEQRKYVEGSVVQKYIEKYINKNLDDPRVDLRLNSTVEDVERIDRDDDDAELPYRFKVTVRTPHDDHNDAWYQEDFDSIVVATGHYHVPHIPHVPGLKKIQETFPEKVQHAKFYRESSQYKGKKVVVVGSRASGADLTKFVAREPGTTVYQSIRNYENTKVLSAQTNVFKKPAIKNYEIVNDKVKVIFEDDSVIEDPDVIIYCTGYLFSYPYLNRLTNHKITEGITIPNLYQHTFLINEPLITIIGVPIDGISFRVFEYQAVLVTRYLTGKISLPSRKEQSEWVNKRYEEKKSTRAFHTIGVIDAFDYSNGLVNLGQVSEKIKVGREFPKITAEEIKVYREAGEKLRKFWDER
ncbi:ustF2 Flavin-containing monooxygenase ustF2 [Candida maltosa Xu316]|uniref:Thiol-specific monooxygenase, putative (Flavin-dependent monooxygenase, putative) n=1 Tax=Candida maltosa (strain Xu316) TaxID=1245528 RepID=M3HIH8_CANMX|nr:Thiol-specific monooxygenase, putative (Flavin-dependent monooxygenase, putative) [Candida maltosa Xu316]